jgi:tetratricopeptide (TPR) repeat protein
MILRRTVTAALVGSLLAIFAASSPAQASKLDRDVAFTRKLATELRFIGLAREEVERLKATHRDSDEFKEVFELGIEISLIGARTHPNREEQRTLFKEALDESRKFIDRYADEPVADRARMTLIEACYEYGNFLTEEIELAREEAPDQVAQLEENAVQVFRDGVEACDRVMEKLESRKDESGSEAERNYYRTWLFKAELQREMARANKRDREPLAAIARETFEELILTVGEESLLGLRAWFEMSKINEILGDYSGAFSDYRDTIDSIQLALDEAETLGLRRDAQEILFQLMQEAYGRGAEALFNQGKLQETLQFTERFRGDLQKYGEEGADPFEIAHPQFGHPVFLVQAKALAESGESDAVGHALDLARRINDEHPNDFIGIRAKALLREILEVRSGLVSGALLFEVAKGDYQNREYGRALQGLKRAYAVMTPEEKQQFGLEVWTLMGRSYGLQERYLEATLAAARGLELHGNDADEASQAAATDVLTRAWQGVRRDTKGESSPPIEQLNDRVVNLEASFGGADSEAKALWRDGNRLLADGKYADAASRFRSVPVDTPYYEVAQGRVVVALQMAEDYKAARAAVQSYLQWIETPEARIPDDRRDLKINRDQTVATVEFYDAYMDYRDATGQGDDGKPDPTMYQPTIRKLEGWLDKHAKSGPNYVGRAYDMISRLHAALGDIGKAEENYRTLRKLEPNSPLVPLLATQLFASHYEQVKRLEVEYQALVEKGAPEAEREQAREQLVQARRAGVASGVDYLRTATSPQYGVLFNTMLLAHDLKDWKVLEEVGRRVIELFGSDATEGPKVEQYVNPMLGEALLRQRRFREAVDLLEKAAAANPNNYAVKRFLSLAQGGWFEFDEAGNLVEVAGLDEPVPAYERHWNEYKTYALNPTRGVQPFDLEWYEFYLECYMFAKRAARKESRYADYAQTLFNIARSTDDFATLRGLGDEGVRIYNLFNAIR